MTVLAEKIDFATLAAGRTLLSRWQNFRRRRRVRAMADMDDHMLEDVGVTRGEIEIAAGMPLTHNPVDELYRMALSRRTSKM